MFAKSNALVFFRTNIGEASPTFEDAKIRIGAKKNKIGTGGNKFGGWRKLVRGRYEVMEGPIMRNDGVQRLRRSESDGG